MEYSDKMNRNKNEKFILVLYSIYSLCMFFVSVEMEWEVWVSFFMLTDLAVCWLAYIGKYRDYRSRAILITFLMQISMLFYGTHARDLSSVTALFVMFVIITGLYGITDIFFLTAISALTLVFYHGVIAGTIRFASMGEKIQVLTQIGSMFLAEFVAFFWVKRWNKSDEQFLETIEVLKEAERSKDDFLANVSHEIRTPINTICGMSEMVLWEDDPRKVKEAVFGIQTAGRNLMSVVSDILDFSELQSGKVELENEAYNITSTINDVINMTLARKEEKNIELIVDCDANLPCALLGDEKKIRRVIMNLVDNAIKFTNEGCVSISIGYRKESYGINLSVCVKDTGIGMKEESLEKLFTSFNQVDTKRNRQEGGIGLGLAISKAIVQKMGGSITVRSKFGKGTTVRFVIPQKVLDDNPITRIEQRESLTVAVYIDFEQFKMMAIRDEYSDNIRHMAEQLDVPCHVCRNLAELKRRMEYEPFSHIFISFVEYMEDQPYFDGLSRTTKVIIVIDRPQEKFVTNKNILRIYKPFYILPIVSVLNGDVTSEDEGRLGHSGRFIAPAAHILVVDDSVMNIKVIEALLEQYQIKVSSATSGREALEMIESMDYDFVFMDHMMPEMDGIETLHRIRKKVGSYYRKVPIIALTANAVAGTRERFLAEGFADFLEKPVELSVLERVLKRNLPQDKLVPVNPAKDRKTLPEEQSKGAPLEGPAAEKEGKIPEEGSAGKDGDEFVLGDLDVQKGILYCGGLEGYKKVLERYCEGGGENLKQTEQLYEKQNWKEYTIAVHGIKSAMMSIGATRLSELAKDLEMAGKEGNVAYILENHGAMAAEYRRVIKLLQERIGTGAAQETGEDAGTRGAWEETIPVLDEAQMDEKVRALEEAMYALDGTKMLEVITELQGYQYCGMPLREPLALVRRKVEMSDYMSAADVVQKLRERLQNSGKGGRKE